MLIRYDRRFAVQQRSIHSFHGQYRKSGQLQESKDLEDCITVRFLLISKANVIAEDQHDMDNGHRVQDNLDGRKFPQPWNSESTLARLLEKLRPANPDLICDESVKKCSFEGAR
jgi:hypothetical protein